MFNTPAVNTGRKAGVCQRLQNYLGLPILQMSCRHHTGELHILYPYRECRGHKYIKSNENTLYKRLHMDWPWLEQLIKVNPE